ncbi:hypothetical protein QYZ88_011050 [Lachnospiraceae bacterium C1.1]|nr:hypothetical protein [Lachnospiraceae bacterium C1.1]
MTIEKNSIKISVIIAIIMFVIIALNFGEFSFWYDEFCTIGFIRNGRSLADLIRIFVTDEVSNPPIYTLFLYIWYRLFPHTQSALLFPNLLFYFLGTFFLLKTLVRDTGVKISALICSIFCLVNSFAVKFQIYELRSYAMLFMFSSMVLSSYCECRSDKSRYNIMLFSIATLLCSMTHYFGFLAVSGFGFFELALAIKDKDKAKLKNLFVYIPTAIISVFWLILCMIYKTRDISVFWKGRPGLKDIADVLNCFYGRNYLYFLIMVLMFTYCIYRVIKGKDSIVEYKKRL